jgi:hypothetical protein
MTDNPVELGFSANVLWDGKNGGQIALRNLAPLKIDALPEFGGKGEQPFPDELFFASIGGCLSYIPLCSEETQVAFSSFEGLSKRRDSVTGTSRLSINLS